MFSIRHIQLSGHEDIYLASRVSFQPEVTHEQKGGLPSSPTIFIDRPDGSTMPINGGTIFVMNDNGKTVARYDIGASMVPLAEGAPPTGKHS